MARIHFAPGAVFAVCVALYMAVAVALTWLAFDQPWLGVKLRTENQSVIIKGLAPGSSLEKVFIGARLISLAGEEQPGIPISAHDLIEEPDVIADSTQILDFYETQGRLYQALRAGPVDLALAHPDGPEIVTVQAMERRPMSDMPVKYWAQLFVAFVGMLIGTWVVCLRPRDLAVWLFLLSGIGLALSASSAALYSSRELALSKSVFFAASRLNSTGALLFGIGMVTLFLVYPRRLVPKFALALPTLLIGSCIAFVQGVNWPENLVRMSDFIAATMVILLTAIAVQVIANRRDPAARAMLGWLGLSVAIGTGGFVLTTIVPQLLSLEPVLEQSTAFLSFLIIYAGIAMAITRYRLFDLANWSFGFLFYGVGVALLLILDAALIYWLALDRLPAFSIALGMIGLVYLPLRDKVWRLFKRNRQIPAEELYQRVTEIAHSNNPDQKHSRMCELWSDIFNPLQITLLSGSEISTELCDDGRELQLAPVGQHPALSLRLADQGARLFTSRDLSRAKTILSLLDTSFLQHETYLQAISTERLRINRDMHDNIGVLLLSALHTSIVDRKDLLIRQTLTDLRELISNPDKADWKLHDLLADLRVEIVTHFEAADIGILWEVDKIREGGVSHRFVHTLRAFLREGTSNILRHSGATEARVEIGWLADGLTLTLCDNGSGFDRSIAFSGNGLKNLENRVSQLGGRFTVVTSETGTVLRATLPVCCGLGKVAE